jgi:hypothetical protein
MARRQCVDKRCAEIEHRDGPIALETLVGFDATVNLISVLHFDEAHFMTVDPTFFVNQLEVVKHPGTEVNSHRFGWPSAVAHTA